MGESPPPPMAEPPGDCPRDGLRGKNCQKSVCTNGFQREDEAAATYRYVHETGNYNGNNTHSHSNSKSAWLAGCMHAGARSFESENESNRIESNRSGSSLLFAVSPTAKPNIDILLYYATYRHTDIHTYTHNKWHNAHTHTHTHTHTHAPEASS